MVPAPAALEETREPELLAAPTLALAAAPVGEARDIRVVRAAMACTPGGPRELLAITLWGRRLSRGLSRGRDWEGHRNVVRGGEI